MSSDAQKINFGVKSNQSGSTQARDRDHNIPKKLPASIVKVDKTNSIITLKFETQNTPFSLPEVTVPLTGSEYIRYPLKKGDKGFVTSTDANIGNISGLGPKSAANFSQPANLASLIFTLAGNKDWTPTDDQKALLHYGETGTINRDTGKKSKHVVHPDSGVTGSTGKKDDGSYKQQVTLHPSDGAKTSVEDGDHTTTHNKDGITHTSKKKVDIKAQTHNVDAKTNINGDTNIKGNTSIDGLLAATKGMSAGGGAGGGSGGGGGISESGGITGTSVASSGPVAAVGITNTSFLAQPSYQYVTPLTGGTVTLSTTNIICIIDPATTLAALTVAFPSDATVIDGVMLSFSCTRTVTALTLTSGGSFCVNKPTAIPAAGAQYRWLYNATNTTWFLI